MSEWMAMVLTAKGTKARRIVARSRAHARVLLLDDGAVAVILED